MMFGKKKESLESVVLMLPEDNDKLLTLKGENSFLYKLVMEYDNAAQSLMNYLLEKEDK